MTWKDGTQEPACSPAWEDAESRSVLAQRARLRVVHFPSKIDPNPYTRLFYGALATFGIDLVPDARLTLPWLWRWRRRVQILHFHWNPNELYEYRGPRTSLRTTRSWLKACTFVSLLLAARLLGYTLVWTLHEVFPHESLSRRLDLVAARALARASSLLLAHDRATAARARSEIGRAVGRIELVPHGSYIGFYPRGRAREAARAELGISADTFAFLAFGALRHYKRIELLLEAFQSLELPRAALVVAGRVLHSHRSIGATVLAAAARDRRVKPRLGLVPDERVAELFEACDAAVLAREDGWTSGSLVLSLSHGLPVVVARVPAYEELTAGGEAGWLFRPGDPDSLRAALAAAAEDAAETRAKGRAALALAQRLSWDEAAEHTARLMAEAVGGDRAGA